MVIKYKIPINENIRHKSDTGNRKTKQMTTENSFIQLGARTYDPEIGRFMSVDPMFELFPEHSPYQYAYNSPIIWSDPSGMFSQTMYEVGNDGNIWEVVYEITINYGDGDPLMPGGEYYTWSEKSRLGAGSGGGGSSFWDNPIWGSWINPDDGNSVASIRGGGEPVTGSFSYNKKELSGTINYIYDPKKNTEKKVKDAIENWIDWIAESDEGKKRLSKYFKNNYSINIDVSKEGKELAELWNDKSKTNYTFLAGFSTNSWQLDKNAKKSEKSINLGKVGWIYIAREYLNPKYKNSDYIYKSYNIHDVIYHKGYTIFTHEFGHRYDSIFSRGPIDRELSANSFLDNIWEYHHPLK